jgi:HK97 family phage major capsid protein
VIRKLKTTNGDYIFSPNNSGVGQNVVGLPGSIYGTPYSVGQYMPTATVNANVFAVVGDFNYFEIFDRTGITSMIDPYSGALTGQTTLYVYSRTDSRIMQNEAFSAITG